MKANDPAQGVDAVDYLHMKHFAGHPKRELGLCEAEADADISQLVYDARTAASLSQEALAALIGTKKSAISRLEDADYRGHSLGMLRRIAKALGLKVEVTLKPVNAPPKRVAKAIKPVVAVASVKTTRQHVGKAKASLSTPRRMAASASASAKPKK